MPFLFASNVRIDVSRGNAAAIRYMDSLEGPWARSQVTATELIVGARGKLDLTTIDGFPTQHAVVPSARGWEQEPTDS